MAICAVLAALNLVVNLSQYVGYQDGPVRFDAEVGRIARSLLTHGTFADPFGAAATGPSAHTPPAFPALYAAYVAVLGESPAAWMAIKVAGGLVLSLWVGLLPLVSQAFGMGLVPGIVGALLAVAAALRHFPEWDANYTALLVVLLAVRAGPMVWETRAAGAPGAAGRPRAAWPAGVLWALAMHVNAGVLLLFLAWSAALLWRWRGRVPGALVLGGLLLPVVLLVPWTVRNWVVLGSPVVLRGNLGLELAVANNDCAHPGLLQNLASGCFAQQHPDESGAEAARLRAMGEPEYHAQRMREARAWMAEHPDKFLRLTARRFVLWWFPSPLDDLGREWSEGTPPRRARVVWIATALMVVGLVVLAWREPLRAAVLAAPLAIVPTLYYPVQFEDRYRYPVLWVTFLLAGYALAACGARAREGRRAHRKPPPAQPRAGPTRRTTPPTGVS